MNSLNPEHIPVKSTLDSGVTVIFDVPHSETDDEVEEVTAYEILSSAAGA